MIWVLYGMAALLIGGLVFLAAIAIISEWWGSSR